MKEKVNFESEDMLHIKKGEIEYLQFRKLKEYEDKLTHLITLRHGGVSKGEYESLNFRTMGNDSIDNVMKNIDILCKNTCISKDDIFKAKQSHTDNILIIDNNNKNKYRFDAFSEEEYDGYICNTQNIATLVTTADCNPIIIYDKVKNIYANVHSGWKGTVKRIYLKAINILKEQFNSNYEDLIVCVGPSIKSCCFSSEDEDFKSIFTNIWKDEKSYIHYEENMKRFHIDLGYVIKEDLLELGIKKENIVISDICTKCNTESFFSYRDSTERGKKDYGTMATIVELV